MKILFVYDPKKNPEGAFIDGVPMRDVTAAEFERLPLHVQASVRACPFYKEIAPGAQIQSLGIVRL